MLSFTFAKSEWGSSLGLSVKVSHFQVTLSAETELPKQELYKGWQGAGTTKGILKRY